MSRSHNSINKNLYSNIGMLSVPQSRNEKPSAIGGAHMPRIEPIPWNELSPQQRAAMQAGLDSGAYRIALPLQVLAYADHDRVPDDGDRHPNFPRHLLDGTLLELLRIRSAQLGGGEPCMASRKVEGATEEVVACLTTPSLRSDLSDRE